MSCYKPLRAFRTPTGVVFSELARYDIIGEIELPCGQCTGCRERRASDWALRVSHEASCWDANCFLTLTYGRDKVPYLGSLQHRDFQLFMKKLRKFFVLPVRYYMCGEYGPRTQRPHYHACVFGVDFRFDRVESGKSASGEVFYNSPFLSSVWGHGNVSVQDLNNATASYCARYITSKLDGDLGAELYARVDEDGVIQSITPPYAAMSKGIGRYWFEKYARDVFPHDFVVIDGVKRPVPRFYDKIMSEAFDEDAIKFARVAKAREHLEDQTAERLAVREVVHKARVSSLKRDL